MTDSEQCYATNDMYISYMSVLIWYRSYMIKPSKDLYCSGYQQEMKNQNIYFKVVSHIMRWKCQSTTIQSAFVQRKDGHGKLFHPLCCDRQIRANMIMHLMCKFSVFYLRVVRFLSNWSLKMSIRRNNLFKFIVWIST